MTRRTDDPIFTDDQICTGPCGRELPASDFSRRSDGTLRKRCKSCDNAQRRYRTHNAKFGPPTYEWTKGEVLGQYGGVVGRHLILDGRNVGDERLTKIPLKSEIASAIVEEIEATPRLGSFPLVAIDPTSEGRAMITLEALKCHGGHPLVA